VTAPRRDSPFRRRGAAGLLPLLLTAGLLSQGCGGAALPDPREMTFPEVRLQPPEHRRLELANGTVLYLLEDHEVPLVNVRILLRTGAVFDPPGKSGLAELTGRVLRAGGTDRHEAPRLNEEIENMGARLETSIGREAAHASLSVLSADVEEGLGLLAEVLRNPAFPEAEVAKARRKKVEEIRRGNDDPDTIAYRELRAAVYGEDPRGRSPSPEDISGITREDMADFHRRYFHPDRMMVGVSGDIREEDFMKLWERNFGDWEPAPGEPPPFPLPGASPPPAVYLAARSFPQTTIVLGHLAPSLHSPEHYPFLLMNYILGGAGFNSRLTGEIRSNRGLAYSVGSRYRGGDGYGILTAWCKTGNDTVSAAAPLMLEVMESVRREGVTEEELRWAKEAVVNNLIFSIDSAAEIVSRRMSHEYQGLPPDYLERFPERIRAVTREEVGRVAGAFLRPREAAVVVVGEPEGVDDAFAGFGPIRKIELREY
jgi:zinc protease